MHPKYYCLEKSGAHSKLPFTSSNGSVGNRQMLNQLKSSTDSDPINVFLQRPHYYHYYRKNCHHNHHVIITTAPDDWSSSLSSYGEWRPWSYQLLPWTQSPSYLQSFPKDVTLYLFYFRNDGWSVLLCRQSKLNLVPIIVWLNQQQSTTGIPLQWTLMAELQTTIKRFCSKTLADFTIAKDFGDPDMTKLQRQ